MKVWHKLNEEKDEVKRKYLVVESILFGGFVIAWELFMIVIYAIWFRYPHDVSEQDYDVFLYPYFRDVSIMIFFGFGFLMTFMRRAGYSAIGYSLLAAALACQWSIILQIFFEELDEHEDEFDTRRGVGVLHMLNGLFCSAAVLISYGAVLGKVTPLQIVILAFIEPFFYWLNVFVSALKLEALDVGGGMYIHTFGAYFGIAMCFFFTRKATKAHPDNCSSYNSDIFSMAGSIFLWIMWPSFNAAIATSSLAMDRAFFNTFISLCAATATTFVFSRWVSHQRLEMVHVQNSILAGGVVMGVAADLDLHPATPIGTGIVVAVVSVLGYKFLTPFMSHKLNLQDICGIHNLHGMPGLIGSFVAVWATLGLSHEDEDEFPRGKGQAGIQAAAIGVTLCIAILSGLFTGFLLLIVHQLHKILRSDYFNDRYYWHLPSDYEHVINRPEEPEEEMSEIKTTRTGTFIKGVKDNKLNHGKEADSDSDSEPHMTRTGTIIAGHNPKSNGKKAKKKDSDNESDSD